MAYRRRSGALWCEQVDLTELAARFGTPLYVYSGATIDDRVQRLRQAFGAAARICYAVKANGNLSLLRRVHEQGCDFDIVSGGELERLRAAGVPTAGVVFAGVGKERWEIEAALAAGILFFNVESPHELPLLRAAAQQVGRPAPVALRLNPDVAADTHAYIHTAGGDHKFGVSLAQAGEVVRRIVADPWLDLVGYHVHLGSQLREVGPYLRAFERVAAFVDGDAQRSAGVRYYDLGGGFGIAYGRGDPLDVHAVAAALLPQLAARGWVPVLEPGRFVVGDAGVLLTTVLGEKRQGGTGYVIVDAAMNDLLRPALYRAEHAIEPVVAPPDGVELRTVDVVGPVCETGDFLARGCPLPSCQPGALLAVFGAGAYGASMASNYNSRRRPAEVLVDGGDARLVRRRERFADMLRDEVEP